MAFDVYVGSLTRYYSGAWENVAQRWARETGATYKKIEVNQVKDAVTDPEQIRPAIIAWRQGLEQLFREEFGAPLDWDEGPNAPYFTDRPSWEGYGGLLLWAAYTERPVYKRPHSLPEKFFEEPVMYASGGAGSPCSHIRNVNWWLPLRFDPAIRKASIPSGPPTTTIGSSHLLLEQLDGLNRETWRATDSEIAEWRKGSPDDKELSLEGWARFGFTIFRDLAKKAVEHRLPMLLDF